MEELNSFDWLPPGWTVEVNVRQSGYNYKDRFYYPPSSGLKFNSKVGVLRFLDEVQNEASSIQGISHNVAGKKGIVEGPPPGWKKIIKIFKKERRPKRQAYYIDPESQYAFVSKPDVGRYLQSGVIGRHTLKLKQKGNSDMESKAEKFSSEGATTKPTLSVSMGQSSDSNMISNDQQIPKSASSGEQTPTLISDHNSRQSFVGNELTNPVLSQSENSEQKEGKVGLAESALVLGSTDENAQEKKLQEDSETKHGTEKARAQNRQHRYKRKKEINLPRRSSKRLAAIIANQRIAAIKANQVPEFVTNNQSCRAAVKQSGEQGTIINADKCTSHSKQSNALEDESETKCKSDSNENTTGSPKLYTPEKFSEKTLEVHRSDKGKKMLSFLPQQNQDSVNECVKVTEYEHNVDAKLDYTFDFPMGEILTDPCIAFAIETLTGETFETSKTTQTSPEFKNSEHPETSAAAAEEHGKKIIESSDDTKRSKTFAIPGDVKTEENAGASSGKTLGVSWMDPSFEFTIKPFPKDSDQNLKNCLLQQLSSLNIQHFGTYKPIFKQPFVDPTLQDTRKIGIGSGDSRGEDRRNVR